MISTENTVSLANRALSPNGARPAMTPAQQKALETLKLKSQNLAIQVIDNIEKALIEHMRQMNFGSQTLSDNEQFKRGILKVVTKKNDTNQFEYLLINTEEFIKTHIRPNIIENINLLTKPQQLYFKTIKTEVLNIAKSTEKQVIFTTLTEIEKTSKSKYSIIDEFVLRKL